MKRILFAALFSLTALTPALAGTGVFRHTFVRGVSVPGVRVAVGTRVFVPHTVVRGVGAVPVVPGARVVGFHNTLGNRVFFHPNFGHFVYNTAVAQFVTVDPGTVVATQPNVVVQQNAVQPAADPAQLEALIKQLAVQLAAQQQQTTAYTVAPSVSLTPLAATTGYARGPVVLRQQIFVPNSVVIGRYGHRVHLP